MASYWREIPLGFIKYVSKYISILKIGGRMSVIIIITTVIIIMIMMKIIIIIIMR